MRTRHARRRLSRLIERLVEASDWDRSQKLIKKNPELLSKAAERLLVELADSFDDEGDQASASIYRFNRSFLKRCRYVGVEHAISEQREASRVVPVLVSSGIAGVRRYRETAGSEHLSAAVSDLERAASMTLLGHPDRPVVLSNLGLALVVQWSRDRRSADLDRSIVVLEEAVRLTERGSREHSTALTNLGIALLSERDFALVCERVERAVEVLEESVDLIDDDALERGRRLTNLGVALSDRYKCSSDPDDLNRAVRAYEAAVAVAEPNSPEHPSWLANLSTGLAERYARSGEPADLDRALGLIEQAIDATGPEDPDRTSLIENFSLMLRDRYTRDGDLIDLDRAVDQLETAAFTAGADEKQYGLLDQLATTLRMRAARHGNVDELRRAVELHRQATNLVAGPAERCVLMNNLAGSLRGWAAVMTGGDRRLLLDEAVGTYRAALDLAASPDDRATVLANLGVGLLDRYDNGRSQRDLDEAIEVLVASVTDTDRGSVDLPIRLNSLGNGLRRRYERDRRPGDADGATSAYRGCCASSAGAAAEAGLRGGLNWGRWACERSAWAEAQEAFEAARGAADRLLAVHVTRDDKETWLAAFGDMSAQAARAYCELDSVDVAAVWLEWGRARTMTDALDRQRIDLADLERRHRALAQRFRVAAARVRALENVGTDRVGRKSAGLRPSGAV